MIVCPGDGIGIRTGLRNQVLRVRVSPRAPKVFYASVIQLDRNSVFETESWEFESL